MQRTCRYVPFRNQPLRLVLCQVRISPVQTMADYMAPIQEEFRRQGFPIERQGKVQQLMITPTGLQQTEQMRWEYRSKDETRSILVFPDAVVVQTTAYERFEKFAEDLRLALGTVLTKTENDKLGLVHRIGLRYVDLVAPRDGEDYRLYLQNGLHGLATEAFKPGTARTVVQTMGATDVGGTPGGFIVRVTQNDQGLELPPDLLGDAPTLARKAQPGKLVAHVDMDHFVEGNFDAKVEWVVEKAYQLHDHIIETFHEHVITSHARKVWE